MPATRFAAFCLVLLFSPLALHAEDEKEPSSESQSGPWVTSIAQIGDSDQFVAGTAQGLLLRESHVQTFAADNPSELSKLYSHPAAVWCVVASANGKQVASVDYRGNLVVYDMASKQPKTHEKAFERWCQTMIWSPGQSHLIAGNEAGRLFAWEMGTGKRPRPSTWMNMP